MQLSSQRIVASVVVYCCVTSFVSYIQSVHHILVKLVAIRSSTGELELRCYLLQDAKYARRVEQDNLACLETSSSAKRSRYAGYHRSVNWGALLPGAAAAGGQRQCAVGAFK